MSDLRESHGRVIAIFCADLHLCHKRPSARADEDWYEVMGGYLQQLRCLSLEHQAEVFCAGDVFDRWNSPAQLINFASHNAPKMYSIAGQHDLPYHGFDLLDKSAFLTLCTTGTLELLSNDLATTHDGFYVSGFSWGQEIKPVERIGASLQIALIHSYIWEPGACYSGAPDETRVEKWADRLQSYDLAIFGDNHTHFKAQAGGCTVWNCGTFIRRKADEIDYKPCVGLLYEDGEILPHYLDTSGDRFFDFREHLQPVSCDELQSFLHELESLDADRIDFRQELRRAAERVPRGVRETLLEVIDANT